MLKIMNDVKLSAEQYWNWRTTVAEMQLAEANYEAAKLRYGQMLKDLEIARLQALLFQKSQMITLEEKHNLAKKDYDDTKKAIEDQLQISLHNCVISDVDYSVKKLDE